MDDILTVEADVVWEGDMAMVARTDSHHFVTMDALPKDGGKNSGPRPMEMVACVNVHVTGKRRQEPPSVFEELILEYRVRGSDLTEADLKWAVGLSVSKYCSVLAMLKETARVIPRWTLEPSAD